MTLSFIPSERLRVFISSAQSNEDGFAWSDVRRRIKDYLSECPYLNPFIIEDVASTKQSTQFFQRQVEKSDVVVLLVKGEVRQGTALEYALATRLKKPLLVYFLEDGTPDLSVVSLKNDIQSSDICTYHQRKDFDDVEIVIRNHIIEDVIRTYQDKAMQDVNEEAPEAILVPDVTVTPTKHSVPTKTVLSLFSSSYNYIFDLLGIGYVKDDEPAEQSILHDLGVSALTWLVAGRKIDCDNGILNLIANAPDVYSKTDWLQKRWDAIRLELDGDPEKALEHEVKALSMAREAGLPTWIINDILIDCRNIEQEIGSKKHEWIINSDYQKELSASDTIVYLPVLDRYLCDIYGSLSKEELRFRTASRHSRLLGTSIGSTINNVENYFFAAMLYGSYTHMMISREVLTKVLYKFAELTGTDPLLFDVIKMLVVRGDASEFKKILNHDWDDVYAELASNADDIWSLTDCAPPLSRDAIKQAVLTELGLYLSESAFCDAETYLGALSARVYWGDSENYFECIYKNSSRLNPEKVIEMLIGIVEEQRFHLGRKLANIFLQIKLDGVAVDKQKRLHDALVEKIPYIIKNGGTPQIIASLASQNPDVFSDLVTIPENGLRGIEKDFYDINMGHGSWLSVLNREIDTARHQFEINKTPGRYTGFFELPYAMIKKIMRSHYDPSMNGAVVHRLFPLCTDVLKSETEIKIKNDCIDCLCDVLVCAMIDAADMPEELLSAISTIDISDSQSIIGASKGSFACRVLMLKLITGNAKKDDLLEWCVDYNAKDENERIALAECIEQFLLHNQKHQEQIDITILSLVLQCFADKYYEVRMRACDCLALLLEGNYRIRAERKLYEAAIDPSQYVRNQILILCLKGKILDSTIRRKLLESLSNDANHALRRGALKHLAEC